MLQPRAVAAVCPMPGCFAGLLARQLSSKKDDLWQHAASLDAGVCCCASLISHKQLLRSVCRLNSEHCSSNSMNTEATPKSSQKDDLNNYLSRRARLSALLLLRTRANLSNSTTACAPPRSLACASCRQSTAATLAWFISASVICN